MWAKLSPQIGSMQHLVINSKLRKQKAYDHFLFPRQENVLREQNLVKMLNLPPTSAFLAKLFCANFLKNLGSIKSSLIKAQCIYGVKVCF